MTVITLPVHIAPHVTLGAITEPNFSGVMGGTHKVGMGFALLWTDLLLLTNPFETIKQKGSSGLLTVYWSNPPQDIWNEFALAAHDIDATFWERVQAHTPLPHPVPQQTKKTA